MSSKRQPGSKGKLGHVVQIRVCRKGDALPLYYVIGEANEAN